jgi:hypothetical protein
MSQSGPQDSAPPRRRRLFWAAVAVAIAFLVGGGVLAIVGLLKRDDPAATVRGYFGALQRGNAPEALGYGDLPRGDHQLLTSDVLREQHRLGAITHLAVLAINQSGPQAKVTVQYALTPSDPAATLPNAPVTVADSVDLVRRDGRWRLTDVAVPVELQLPAAKHRAMILRAPVPTGSVLVFPGALPITFDTEKLALDQATSAVRFSAAGPHNVAVSVTSQGKDAINKAVTAALNRCLAATATDPTCPMPSDDRAVPGTLHGSIKGSLPMPSVQIIANPDGRVEITGTATVNGSYNRLNFDNMPQTRTGSTQVKLAAFCYLTSPTSIVWDAS